MSAIRTLNREQLKVPHWVPWAMIDMTTSQFSRTYGVEFDSDRDDLDGFTALYLLVNGHQVALKHYNGEPDSGITIYLQPPVDAKLSDRIVNKILKNYDLPAAVISWGEVGSAYAKQ